MRIREPAGPTKTAPQRFRYFSPDMKQKIFWSSTRINWTWKACILLSLSALSFSFLSFSRCSVFSLLSLSSMSSRLSNLPRNKLNKNLLLIVCGASKIKLKKVNKKITVALGRVFLNISRHPLLIWLHCWLHQYKTLKAVATVAIVVLTPAKNLNKVFWRFLVVSPLFNHFLGYV